MILNCHFDDRFRNEAVIITGTLCTLKKLKMYFNYYLSNIVLNPRN